ncbi:MAG: TRAP transporter substrate-binding protein [Deltaproteobacteria bacterium]|nr:TRAP transporter substrate-binding protein [Deltaproteobacteria bacterium]
MKRGTKVICALIAGFMLVVSGYNVQAADTYTLKIQTAVPSASIYFQLIERMAKRIHAMSNERLKVEVLPAGAVVGVFEILDGVDKGIINGGQAWTHYWSGKHPAGLLFSAPCAGLGYGLDQVGTVSWIYDGGGNKLYQEYFTKILHYNIKGFMCMPMGPEPFGWFSKPFTTLEELKKVKFRAPPGIPSESFKLLGMPVVSMPGGEIVPAAQRGVIDAAEWISPADDKNLGLSSVWKHYYLQGLHQAISVGDIYINLDWWKKLPADLKAIFKAGIMSCIADTYNWNVSQNSKALKDMVEKEGVKLHETSDEYIEAYMEATKKILDKYAKKDPFFKKVLISMQAWAKLTVPYQTYANGVYHKMGKAALDAGIVGYGK